MNKLFVFIYLIFSVATAMISHTIHQNWFYSVLDFFFTPIAWIWWLLGHDVTLSIIQQTFAFFLK